MSSRVVLLCAVVLLLCMPALNAFFWNFGCPPCEFTTCAPVHCDVSLQVLDPKCGCCPVCANLAAEYQRCGGLENVKCQRGLVCRYRPGNVWGEDRMGMCETELCNEALCGFRQYCDARFIVSSLRIYCRCPKMFNNCEGKVNPHCGNDRVTYTSLCHLYYHECYYGKFVGVNHKGACRDYSSYATESPSITMATTPPPRRVKPNNQLEGNVAPATESTVATMAPTPRRPTDPDYLFKDTFNDAVFPPPALPEHETVTESEMGYVPRPAHSCWYNGKTYQPGTINPIQNDPCRYLVCNPFNVLVIAPVLGCPGNPPEIDPGNQRRPRAGGWTPWSEWTLCRGGCYNSTQSRYRSCTNPRRAYEGRDCDGHAKETRKCFPERCNISCNYTQWSGWSPCSVTCGGGTTTRTRSITNQQDESITRKACDLVETKPCNQLRNCPVTTGPCRKMSLGKDPVNFDYLPMMLNGAHCRTTRKFEVHYCGGTCGGSNSTACCKPIKWRYKRSKQIDCGWIYFWQSDVPVVAKCGCVEEEGSGGSGDELQ